ncbi:MAG: multicopper oxidase domain-containing protein [Methylococcales bacterium]|nr:multicopper oxidase domain-containing protein [Methylococcales bacterium]MDD5754796.1 multicopper oxidase domain-containing protein [Methylococcales bacterium]
MKTSFLPLIVTLGFSGSVLADGKELVDPPVFASSNKVLDLLMIAKPVTVGTLPGVITGWAYEICKRQYANKDGVSCQTSKTNTNPYGGVRLQLNAGDTLKVHLVNKLPQIPESKHKDDPTEGFLSQNPTNIHTHGMLVSPRYPSSKNPTYGDNVFVLTFNSNNGMPEMSSTAHSHGDMKMDAIDYQITLPRHHPSGLYWFHPHAHGISLNQLSAGLSGIITVGKVTDYVPTLPSNVNERYLILKDGQVNADGSLHDQEDPDFCDDLTPSVTTGACNHVSGGKWYFTINGQLNPTINVKSSGGELWRITNASGSVTYDLQLNKKTNGNATNMMMQLVSVDGVSATPTLGISQSNLNQIGGTKFESIECPSVKSNDAQAICVNKLRMMPGTRAEVWVVNRDVNGKIISGNGDQATFQTAGYSTGESGDTWPAVDLAQVTFLNTKKGKNPPVLNVDDRKHDTTGLNFNAIAQDLAVENAAVSPDSSCKPLPNGWKRRIFFGIPTNADFGLGFELVDEKGQPVVGSFQDVAAFPDAKKSICLPLSIGNTPINEHWELINLATEDHNFHIHQTKFRVLSTSELQGNPSVSGILQDSVPLPTGDNGCDGSVNAWRKNVCKTSPVDVEIPFAIAGDFVYHCHILEHEDGGMMATIHIAGSSKSVAFTPKN